MDDDEVCERHYLRVLYFRLLCLSSEADAMALQAHFCKNLSSIKEVDDEFPAAWTSGLLRAAMCRLWNAGLADSAIAATGAGMLVVRAKQGERYQLLDASPEFYCISDAMWDQRCTHVIVSTLFNSVPTIDVQKNNVAFDSVARMISERSNTLFDEWLIQMDIDIPPERLDADQADEFTSGAASATCFFQDGCQQCRRARKVGKVRKKH